MKLKFIVFLTLFTLAACGQSTEPTLVVADVQIELQVDPDPPAAGETTLIITLTDAAGAPVDNATILVHGDMDHEGMEPVDREVTSGSAGAYQVPFVWTMGGGWIVDVTATLPDNGGAVTETFEFFVEAVSSGSIINRSDDEDEAMDMENGEMSNHESGAMEMTEEPDTESESG